MKQHHIRVLGVDPAEPPPNDLMIIELQPASERYPSGLNRLPRLRSERS